MTEAKTFTTPDKMLHFAVLMSTYNGFDYLMEQVESILSQTGVRVTLFIRDDGSTDSRTTNLLSKLADSNTDIRVILGKNIGVVKSFFELLASCDDTFNYYAFADQDDVWLPDKLLRAALAINSLVADKYASEPLDTEMTIPAMYYGRLEFVDKQLRHLGYSAIPSVNGFHNALVQNQATGCTIVLNRAAREFLSRDLPNWALMHDWWCYLVVSAFGRIYYDVIPGIKYRKHGNNVTPATPHFILELFARTRRFLGDNDIPEKVTDQAREFRRIYGEKLTEDQKIIVDGFLRARSKGVIARIFYAIQMPVCRNTPLDNLIMRFLIIIGRF
jgi:glycosyltransferase involved in cell wall biosynthesis